MLFKEIIPVYTGINTKTINTNAELLIGKAGGTYSYYWALNDH
jgi:hypothetical protein